jgi:hypothetical protein
LLQALTPSVASDLDLSKIVLAIGGLGTAAYGLVDITKSMGGGISNRGFGDIKKIISQLIPASSGEGDAASARALPSVLATLRANWLNGMAMADQKSVAKALIKLNLNANSAAVMAAATGVNATLLGQISAKLVTQQSLEPAETDVYGRFDLSVSALLDQGYQRADQRYRNSAKIAAVFVSVLLALVGTWTIYGNEAHGHYGVAFIAGLLATPLAPVAKDLSSAIQAGAKAAQSWKR